MVLNDLNKWLDYIENLPFRREENCRHQLKKKLSIILLGKSVHLEYSSLPDDQV